MNAALEMCIICDKETGHCGRTDDSIYGRLNFICPNLNLKPNDNIGPLCEDCAYTLDWIGFADFYWTE